MDAVPVMLEHTDTLRPSLLPEPASESTELAEFVQCADVTVHLISARNLPRGLLAPRPVAQVYCALVPDQPLASTPPASRTTAPNWNFDAEVQVPHHPGTPPTLRFAVFDADTKLGTATLTLCAHRTRAWIPLEDAGRADILVAVYWDACPRDPIQIPTRPAEDECEKKGRAWNKLRNRNRHRDRAERQYINTVSETKNNPNNTNTPKTDNSELRVVDWRTGALFRTGMLAVQIVASGVPVSVAQPFVTLRTADQVLRAGECEKGKQWWTRRCELESFRREKRSDQSSPPPPPPAATPATSDVSNASGSGTAGVSAESDQYSTDDGAVEEIDVNLDDELLSNRSTLRRRLKKHSSAMVSSVNRDGVRASGKRAIQHTQSIIMEKADSGAAAVTENARKSKPTRSSVGATLTSAKIRRSRPKRDNQTTTTTATVLQNLLAPRVRRPVDFGVFWFAETQGVPATKLGITLTDRDSHLFDALGAIFESDVLLDLGKHGESTMLGSCELGPPRGKISAWIRVTRVAATHPPHATATMVTPRFRELFTQFTAKTPDREREPEFKERYPHAERLTYLFVGGLFTNYYPLYFSRNVDYLQQSLKLPRVQCVPINTESGLAANARTIAAAVSKTATRRKSVVLLGHSKGALDIMEAISKHIEIIPFIYGVISFQAPFLGTYAIDFLQRAELTDAISTALETLWHGERESLLDLSYGKRSANLDMFVRGDVENSRAIALREIPVVSFATCASFDLHAMRTPAGMASVASMAAVANEITGNTGFCSDGLVASVDAMVPFSDVVYLNDMSHLEPANYVPGTSYPPGELTAAALVLLFEKAQRSTTSNQ